MFQLSLSAALVFAPLPAADAMIFCPSPGITDGDTFRCGGDTKIRLWGVNAPERNAAGGPAATRALAAITRGKAVVCKRKGKSYDRIVAQCWVDRRDVAADLVRQGHAVDWPRYSKGYYARVLRNRPDWQGMKAARP